MAISIPRMPIWAAMLGLVFFWVIMELGLGLVSEHPAALASGLCLGTALAVLVANHASWLIA